MCQFIKSEIILWGFILLSAQVIKQEKIRTRMPHPTEACKKTLKKLSMPTAY